MPVQVLLRDRESLNFKLAEARWGFVPGWWKQPKPPSSSHNARTEEAADKPMWRYSYTRARCLIPAVGWYEWQEVELPDPRTGEIKAANQPHFIRRGDGRLVVLAGLMSIWYPNRDTSLLTCAVLTRDAAPSVADVHDRMPAVMPRELVADWLNPDIQRPEDVTAMLQQVDTDFVHWLVTRRLNAAKTDEDEFILPIH
jgi:putative SOS response-associated peptidase YedK